MARDGALTPAMTDRFLGLARYATSTGADAILLTCSAFGPCIEACAREFPAIPVLKPNEAMIEDAAQAAASLQDCDVIALAQFSLSRAAAAVAAATGKPVLTTPDSAVRKLQHLLLAAKQAA